MARTYPIILVPGIGRFDVLCSKIFKTDNNDRCDRWHYFRNIRTHLMDHGFDVYHARVSWAASLDVCARELAEEVDRALKLFDAEKVHIIGHSMGGLDARKMLYDFRESGIPKKVASLTTIGTPHHGTSSADFFVRWFGWPMRLIAKILGTSVEGLWDLTLASAAELNREIGPWEDAQTDVSFQAYAGKQRFLFIFSLLKLSWPVIHHNQGANDGLSPVVSARWNEKYFVEPVLDLDHLNQIGWWDLSEILHGVSPRTLHRNVKQLYLTICEGLE